MAHLWALADFERYWRVRHEESQARTNREAQAVIQGFIAQSARAGGFSGLQVAGAAAGYAHSILYVPTMESLDAFEEAAAAVGRPPAPEDYEELEQRLRRRIDTLEPQVATFLGAELDGRLGTHLTTDVARQSADRARRELRQEIERRQIAARNRDTPRDAAGELVIAVSDLNAAARARLGLTVFQITEPRVFVDVASSPNDEATLAARIQSLGLLFDQVNSKELRSHLEGLGKKVPDGSLRRLEAFLLAKGIAIPEGVIGRLRDIRELRNLYPAHPSDEPALGARERLGVRPQDGPAATWARVLRLSIEALRQLRDAIERP